MLNTTCPQCRIPYELDDSLAGQKVQCTCSYKFIVAEISSKQESKPGHPSPGLTPGATPRATSHKKIKLSLWVIIAAAVLALGYYLYSTSKTENQNDIHSDLTGKVAPTTDNSQKNNISTTDLAPSSAETVNPKLIETVGKSINPKDSTQLFAQFVANQGDAYIKDRVPAIFGLGLHSIFGQIRNTRDTLANYDQENFRLLSDSVHALCPCGKKMMEWDPRFPNKMLCLECDRTFPNAKFPEDQILTVKHWKEGTVDIPYHRKGGKNYFFTGMIAGFKHGYTSIMLDACSDTYVKTGGDRFARVCRTAFIAYARVLPHWPCASRRGYESHDRSSRNQALWVDTHWGYRHSFTLPNKTSDFFTRVKESPLFQAPYESGTYHDYINQHVFDYLIEYLVSYPEDFGIHDNLGTIPRVMQQMLLDNSIPRAAHYVKRYLHNMFYDYSTEYDGMSIEGPSYHGTWFHSAVYPLIDMIGYQDPDGYVDAVDGTTLSQPLTLEDIFPPSQRMRTFAFAHDRMDLPNGTMAGVHDNRNTAKDGLHTTECISRIQPGFGHLTFGDGKLANQVQTQFHFSRFGGHSHRDSLTYQLYAHERPLFEFSGHQDYFKTTCNKNTVVVNHLTQEKNPSRGRMDFSSATAPGVKMTRVEADYMVFGSTKMKRYRRTLVQNTIDIERPYVIDVFDAHGGDLHEYLLGGSMFHEQSAAANMNLKPLPDEYPLGQGDWQFYKNATIGTLTKESYVDFTFDDGKSGSARVHLPANTGDKLLLSRLHKKPNVHREVDQVAHRPHLMIRRGNAEGSSDDLRSLFVTVHEAYRAKPFIESVVQGKLNNDTFAIQVKLADRTDTYLISRDKAQLMKAGGCETDAIIAAFSKNNTGQGVDIWMAGGTYASAGKRSLKSTYAQLTAQIKDVHRTLDGDPADAFLVDMDLPIGMALRGQMIYLDCFNEDGTRQVVNGFEITEVKPGPMMGQRLVLTRQDSGAVLSRGNGVKFSYWPQDEYPKHQLRFVNECSTVPRIAHISPEKDRWSPEPWQDISGNFFAKTLHPEITTIPANAKVTYTTEIGEKPSNYTPETAITEDSTITFSVANPSGVMPGTMQTERYFKARLGTKDKPHTPRVITDKGEVIKDLSHASLSLIDGSATLKGWIHAPSDGMYIFHLFLQSRRGIDASLDISDHQLISTNPKAGMKPVRPLQSSMYLESGWHPIKFRYHNAGDHRSLKWSGPGFDYQDIPEGKLIVFKY